MSAEASGRVIAQRYRLGKRLGKGGMGEVYEAEHLEIPRRFAIKLLRGEYAEDPQMHERFRREAKAAASLTSDHIVQVVDYGRDDAGAPYLVMELLEGSDMRCALRQRGPLSVGEAVEIVMQACVGAELAHAQSIVHRDLKPENLFLAHRSGRCLVKVLDFGVAKLHAQGNSTAAGKLLGTPAYMSPEQARAGAAVDVRTDVYAMGVILYEALTLQLPHPGEGAHEIISHLLLEEPVPVTRWNAQIPEALAAVIHKAISRVPADRFQNVAALRSALEPFASSSLALAHTAVSDAQETQPARDSEVRSPSAPSVPDVVRARAGAEPRRSARSIKAWAVIALASALLLGLGVMWQRAEQRPLAAVSAPRARRAAALHTEPSTDPRPAASASVALPATAPEAASVSVPATLPSTPDSSPLKPRRAARPRSAQVATPTEPAASVSAPDAAAAAPVAEREPAPAPSTIEVRHGKQTIVFMGDNPLRR